MFSSLPCFFTFHKLIPICCLTANHKAVYTVVILVYTINLKDTVTYIVAIQYCSYKRCIVGRKTIGCCVICRHKVREFQLSYVVVNQVAMCIRACCIEHKFVSENDWSWCVPRVVALQLDFSWNSKPQKECVWYRAVIGYYECPCIILAVVVKLMCDPLSYSSSPEQVLLYPELTNINHCSLPHATFDCF